MKRLPDDLAAKLIDAGEQLSGTNLDVSIDEMAQMAEIPRATLYYYFSGKDDLISFFLQDKLNRASVAVQKAINSEGTVVERLERTLGSVMEAMAAHPTLCTEMPAAVRDAGKYGEVVSGAERLMVAPFRDLLIEGKATGELVLSDVDTAAVALMGAVNMVAMFQLVQTGTLDVEKANAALIPQLMQGLLPR
ncbi:MAG: TetR/AcrR family transcriptional regulator [Acidimicrobiia bacterium]|nr:TetR/AcrR family transcriptional regulator [Acidimicrobiia bacterium]